MGRSEKMARISSDFGIFGAFSAVVRRRTFIGGYTVYVQIMNVNSCNLLGFSVQTGDITR
jgi:hypothetical protein